MCKCMLLAWFVVYTTQAPYPATYRDHNMRTLHTMMVFILFIHWVFVIYTINYEFSRQFNKICMYVLALSCVDVCVQEDDGNIFCVQKRNTISHSHMKRKRHYFKLFHFQRTNLRQRLSFLGAYILTLIIPLEKRAIYDRL